MKQHAVVLGGSLAGLAAARALAPHFARVTVVERDVLDFESVDARKGVPQGRHGHGLLASGARILEEWFPGFAEEIVDAGATYGDMAKDFLWHQFGAWKLRADCGLPGVVASRPLIESTVRRRVAALGNVSFLCGHDVLEPAFDREHRRVTHARVLDRATGEVATIAADLVVDATGRGSKATRWFEEWGLGTVRTSFVRCPGWYASTTFPRRSGDFHGANGAIVAQTPPAGRRVSAVFAIEGDRWLVTMCGLLGERKLRSMDDFRSFALSLPVRDVFDLIDGREPLEPVRSYDFLGSERRHFEDVTDLPERFLVIGDAISSFTPTYGQGMSVALAEAKTLEDCLARPSRVPLARRFFREAARIIDSPWMIAASEDMRHPEVEGERPAAFGWTSAYFARVHRAAAHDEHVLRKLFEVASLVRSPSAMFSPDMVVRVLLRGGRPAPRPVINDETCGRETSSMDASSSARSPAEGEWASSTLPTIASQDVASP